VPSDIGQQTAETATPASEMATGDMGRIKKTAEERKDALDRQLQQWGAQGWRIENRSDYQATIAKGKALNNTFHLLLTIFTAGLWGIVWLILAITGGLKRRMITIDEFGNPVEQKL
jgi:hypothetical protein